MRLFLAPLILGLIAPAHAALPSRSAAASEATAGIEPARMQGLLQRFVDKLYLKAFRHLEYERDFDHGHVLYAPASKTPVAILYHTQGLAQDEPAGSDFGFLDPGARNWIQWMDRDGIENADRYQRASFPDTASWRWFQAERLPSLRRYHTILDKMLDPERVGAETSDSRQLVFTRFDCASPPAPRPGHAPIDIRLPTGEKICLALSAS